jgi:excinuclease ABC subunit A
LGAVVLVDQSPLGRTPRSNPAVYIGAFEDIRDFFARTPAAKELGLNSSAFSFNSAAGQCEKCRGAGFEKVEMQFLSDIYIRCAECLGRRYRQHILDVKISVAETAGSPARDWSIADLLEATVEDAIDFLRRFSASEPAQRAANKLALLAEVGLGYLRVGQPINTLSGGESQRLKLVSHLAASAAIDNPKGRRTSGVKPAAPAKPTFFVFDEPTTGLHFDDVRVLLQVFQRLVNAGHSVLVIEHNLDVIKCADWVLDLGPEAGEDGGHLVVAGTPEAVAQCLESHTGQFLRGVLRS